MIMTTTTKVLIRDSEHILDHKTLHLVIKKILLITLIVLFPLTNALTYRVKRLCSDSCICFERQLQCPLVFPYMSLKSSAMKQQHVVTSLIYLYHAC